MEVAGAAKYFGIYGLALVCSTAQRKMRMMMMFGGQVTFAEEVYLQSRHPKHLLHPRLNPFLWP